MVIDSIFLEQEQKLKASAISAGANIATFHLALSFIICSYGVSPAAARAGFSSIGTKATAITSVIIVLDIFPDKYI
jgi:hypothetical protein